jgi:hypothetical protein
MHGVQEGVIAAMETPIIAKYYFGDDVIEFIKSKIPVGSTIVELGSGQSTVVLAEDYKVYSIEDDARYLNQTTKATYIHAPLEPYYSKDFNVECRWYNRKAIKMGLPENYDLLIVDGPECSPYGRYGVCRYLDLFNRVPILIDDLQSPLIYMVALMLARVRGNTKIDVRVTSSGRVYGWLE